MLKYTSHTQEKLIDLLQAMGYKVRYEKGNFKAGYCIINNHKVVVINRFFTQELKINTLIDIIMHIAIDPLEIEDTHRLFYHTICKEYKATHPKVIA